MTDVEEKVLQQVSLVRLAKKVKLILSFTECKLSWGTLTVNI